MPFTNREHLLLSSRSQPTVQPSAGPCGKGSPRVGLIRGQRQSQRRAVMPAAGPLEMLPSGWGRLSHVRGQLFVGRPGVGAGSCPVRSLHLLR